MGLFKFCYWWYSSVNHYHCYLHNILGTKQHLIKCDGPYRTYPKRSQIKVEPNVHMMPSDYDL